MRPAEGLAARATPLARVAGAPISWGVCEVPGWGHQLPAGVVLGQMRDLGLEATELGPDGFLPGASDEKALALSSYGLAAVGGFVPVVLHDGDRDVRHEVATALESLVATGARTLVLAADAGTTGYDQRVVLDDGAWKTLLGNVEAVTDAAQAHGVTVALHPHVGTVVESRDDVDRLLDASAVALCLDTGHLLIGGTDPAELAASVPDRVAHVHLKDVDDALAERVRAGELSYTDAVARGMYRPLGQGDVDIAGIVRDLEAAGYAGWYVLEQDTVLDTDPPPGSGPVEDVRASLDFLRSVAP
ncbi:MAG: TIM barrel protein [Actinomycetota bacterium]|nr:TIM barrel protein [Actinomycetota bacterium]